MTVGGSGGSTATSSTNSACATERPERRDTTPASAQSQSAFESALRSKQSRRERGKDDERDDERGDQRDSAADGALAGLAANFAGHQPALRPVADDAPASSPRSCDLTPSGTRAAMEAALNANVAPGITDVGASDPAALWEASVREPNAIPVDVRVLRAEKTGQEANTAWTVSVRAQGVSADTLVRHAPRLDERLRKHAVGFSHVRIEEDEQDAE